jgi:TorA maturation chaperone TorD
MTTSAGNRHGPHVHAATAGTRAAVYELLAALYLSPPSPELVAGILRTASGEGWSDGPGAEHLRRFAAGYDGNAETLHQEFDDLFVVPLGRYVTPYEAVYRDERIVGESRVGGLLMGPSTLGVLSAYREGGVGVPPECGELPDHIGIELSFMARLCAREREAFEAGDERAAAGLRSQQVQFLQTHLLHWLPALSERIVRSAESDFYRGIALLTEELVRADAVFAATPDREGRLERLDV